MAVFDCPVCDIHKTVPDKYLGRKVRCPDCQQDYRVGPGAQSEKTAPAQSPQVESRDEAVFRCEKCGYTEPADFAAVGEERVCRQCSAKGRVVVVTEQVHQITEEDVQLDDLVEALAEDVSEDMEDDMDAIMSSPVSAAANLSVPFERVVAGVSFWQGHPFHNLLAGLATGVVSFFFCIALAMLIFPAGVQAGYFAFILDALLLSAIVGMVLSPLRSGVYFGVSALDPAGVTVLFCLLSMLMQAMPGAEAATILPTALALVAGMTIATGVLAWITWAFKSGSWVRFMPIQIIGGVLAGLGVTVLYVAWKNMTGVAPTLDLFLAGVMDWQGVLASGSLWAWLPGVCFGALLFVLFHKIRHAGWLALVMLIVTGLGYGLKLLGLELPPELANDYGTLSYAAPDVTRYTMLYADGFFASVDWGVLYGLRVEISAGVILLLTMSLHKITRVERELGDEVRLEKELQVLGVNNILAGLAGGVPLSFCLGRSLGNRRAGAAGPLASVFAGLVLVGALFFAGPLVACIPSFVPGGLLVFFGLNLLGTWLLGARRQFFRSDDYMLLVLTFIVTVTLGFVLGLATGLALAMMVSVTRYGSGGVVKQVLSGAHCTSHVDRAPAQAAYLKKHGDRVHITRLQGFVTLGSLYGVIRRTRHRVQAADHDAVRIVIYDFSSVQRFGSAMGQGFARLHSFGVENDILMVLTHIPFEIENHLVASGYVGENQDGGLKLFQNFDYAMEWSEDQLLDEAGLLDTTEQPLAELLEPVYPVPEHIPYLMKLLQPIKIKSGQSVFRQGDLSDAMYFVQSGMYRVELGVAGGKIMRLKKIGPGAVFGEMGLFTDAPRSASVIASQGGTVYRLSKKRIALIETKFPKLKSSIDSYLVQLLAGRIVVLNAMVHDLLQ